MNYIALALAPGIAICLYIFYTDIYNREPRINLVMSFIYGGLAILPAVWFESSFTDRVIDGSIGAVAFFSYLIVAFSEEFSKFIGLRFYAYKQKSFDEPLDGIVYSVMVGMGFATVENLLYVLKYAEMGRGLEVGITRMFLSVPAHGTFAVVMGYFAGKAKFSKGRSTALLITGLIGAIFFHGTFDFFLFVRDYSYAGKDFSEALLGGGAIISFIVSLVLSRKLIRRQRNLSKRMFKPENTTTSV